MIAASYSQEVLQALLKEIREFERKPQRNETFLLVQSDFNEWLRVWKMSIPEGGHASKDLFVFQKKTKSKFVDLVKNEIRDLKSAKVSFEMKIKFTKENFETGVTQEMEHYFKEKEPHVFNEHNKQQIKQEFDRFIERAKGQIEAWSERGSGWVIERIIAAYVNVARYQPLKGGTYLPLPANLANKKAIINVQNSDNECLKWALRAALFPPRDGKNLQRTSKYPVNDGINYKGIDFPTPVKQIDKLEAQNSKLAINVGENAVEVFLNCLQVEEKIIKNDLSTPKPLFMTPEDWVKFKNATDCHICEESLIKDYFLDSLPVWESEEGSVYTYDGQWHKKCYYNAKKELDSSILIQKRLILKRLTEEEHKEAAEEEDDCLCCGQPLLRRNFRDAVKDHCHITGNYRGAAHNSCNLKMRIKPMTDQIPVVFHNLRGYDAHHLMQAMSKLSQETQKEVKCVANNMEKYITFSFGCLRFIDSLNFLQGSLDSLVNATPKEALKITKVISQRNSEKNEEFKTKSLKEKIKEIEQNAELLYKKGIFPYEYMDSWERFNETSLPEKEKFYSKLNDEHVTDEEYEHANSVWKTFGCETLGDYHNLYVKTDVTLLADVFENFRNICKEKYELDPAHYFTSPGLSWDALLKKTGVQLELLTDPEMHLFVERGIRGGISMAS
ncbi:hypothetical protein ACROYT_G036308 [Oculina patagonica]